MGNEKVRRKPVANTTDFDVVFAYIKGQLETFYKGVGNNSVTDALQQSKDGMPSNIPQDVDLNGSYLFEQQTPVAPAAPALTPTVVAKGAPPAAPGAAAAEAKAKSEREAAEAKAKAAEAKAKSEREAAEAEAKAAEDKAKAEREDKAKAEREAEREADQAAKLAAAAAAKTALTPTVVAKPAPAPRAALTPTVVAKPAPAPRAAPAAKPATVEGTITSLKLEGDERVKGKQIAKFFQENNVDPSITTRQLTNKEFNTIFGNDKKYEQYKKFTIGNIIADLKS
jgi:hypothetical protein